MSRYRFRPRPNFIWSILSVSAVLSFLGVFIFLTLHSYDLVDRVKGSFEVVVEFSPSATDHDHSQVTQLLHADSTVKAESVAFVDKEAALESLSEEMGVDLANIGDVNPLFDALTFQMKPQSSSSREVDAVIAEIERKSSAVVGFHYQRGLMDRVIANLDRLKIVFLVVGLVMVFLALALIFNSIRLALYANRFLIKNMELVGASWNFIRAPFLRTSIKHGLSSIALCFVLLVILFLVVQGYLPEITTYLNGEYMGILMASIVIIGLTLNLGSTFYVVTKYLRMQSRDLY